MLFCRLLIFFQNQLFRKIISGVLPECQKDWTQIRPYITSGLIWVQTVCKGYQQTTLGGKDLPRYMPLGYVPKSDEMANFFWHHQITNFEIYRVPPDHRAQMDKITKITK